MTRRSEPPAPAPTVEAAAPRAYDPKILDQLIDSGAPPHIVYAYCATGLLVTDDNITQLSGADRRLWDQALMEFERIEWDASHGPRQ